MNQGNPLAESMFNYQTDFDNDTTTLDSVGQTAYNDFAGKFMFSQNSTSKGKQYPYHGINLLNMYTQQSKTTRAGEIRKNYKGEEYWCADPDAEDYGTNSVKYKMLSTLGTRWKNSTNGGEKYKLTTASNMIRTYEANIDSAHINKVLLLNDENGAYTLGHNAVMLLSDSGEGVLFSFNPEGGAYPAANGQTRVKLLTAKQVEDFRKTGKIYNATGIGRYSATIHDETYTGYIELVIGAEQGKQMLQRGIEHATDPNLYLLVGKQCDDTASDIMRAGGCGYYVLGTPNKSFEGMERDWRTTATKIRG